VCLLDSARIVVEGAYWILVSVSIIQVREVARS
jgi:hypothetical protein